MEKIEFPMQEELITHMKYRMNLYIFKGMYASALFYANKLFYLNLNKDLDAIPDLIYDISKCFYLNKEYYRCVNIIQKYNMVYYNIHFLNLLGQALLACEDFESVITYLDKENLTFEKNTPAEYPDIDNSHRHLIVAKAYEMQENKQPAIKNYIQCLKYDCGNIEAFDLLLSHQLLNKEQKCDLPNQLKYTNNDKWLNDYYSSQTHEHIYMTDKSEVACPNNEIINVIDVLYKNNDPEVVRMEAEKFFLARDYVNAYEKLKKINDEDFYKIDVVPMLCSCMIELNKVGEIYYLAHKLSSNCNDKFISWYAVGCYYYCIKKFDVARKYFVRCNQLNKQLPEGLIALGNCYAAQDESDQALGAYRTCLRLFPGCHYANLYIGMEFIRTNNLKTALVAFQDALNVNSTDPLLYNEIGVVFYKQKRFHEAEANFLTGLEICKEDKSPVSQTLTINLAHTYRKMRKYDEAIYLYNKISKIDNRNVSVLTSLAYSLHLKGDYLQALDVYHKANFIKPDDSFTIEMINKCLMNMVDA